jgi:hypothetical protein
VVNPNPLVGPAEVLTDKLKNILKQAGLVGIRKFVK